MSRDATTEAIFTTADDAMQGLWGLHNCVNAAYLVAPKIQLRQQLPQGKFQLTHEWARLYDPDALTEAMDQCFEFVQCRAWLTALVSIFEAATERFVGRLEELGYIALSTSTYKAQLRWVFDTVKNTTQGSATMLARLPATCGDVDNARRLRNAIAHNNGKYDDWYGKDAITDGWVVVHYEPDYQIYLRDKWMPIFLTNSRLEYLSRSHIELLHILHNTIQSKFFGHHEGFSYAEEQKPIEWHRILSGKRAVQM